MLIGLTVLLYAVMVWNLPKIIGGLAAGAPQMSSGGVGSAMAGFAGGMQLGRSMARNGVEGTRSFVDTSKAAGVAYQKRREGGAGKANAVAGTAFSVGKAVGASGVNSLVGRHGRRKVGERITR